MLPDPYGMFGDGHNGLEGGVIYSKPLLPGARPLIPDFMYIACDSEKISPVLIEIEAPTKSVCTALGQATAELTQARAQLTDWATWFAEEGNTAVFQKHYGITQADLRTRTFVPRYVLIYGRRSDVEANVRFAKTRAHLPHREMTYDRLAPSDRYAGWPVAHSDTSQPGVLRFRLVSPVPPVASDLAFREMDPLRIVGVKDALDAQAELSPELKKFLLSKYKRARTAP